MGRIFYGSFGNGRFIKPQYEIEGDMLKSIENRFEEFPNGGTVYLYFDERENIDTIKNRLIKFELDFSKNISQTYNHLDNNSNKYQATLNNIIELDASEVIEVLRIDYSIDELLSDKNKRKIRLDHRPNRKVLIQAENHCYGPFECVVSNDDQYYFVTIVIESEKIRKYSNEDLERYIYPGSFSINSRDSLRFVFNEHKLSLVEPTEEIEFIDNDKLIGFLKKLLSQSNSIEDIASLGESFSKIVNDFSDIEDLNLAEPKIERIRHILHNAEELKSYKMKLSEEYFLNNPNAEIDKQKYLENHEELLNSIAEKNIKYKEKYDEYSIKMQNLQSEFDSLVNDINIKKQELEEQQLSQKKYQERALADKKQELEQLEKQKQEELEKIEENKKKAYEDYRTYENIKHTLEEDVKKMRTERDSIKDDINKKILGWASENRNSEIVNVLFSELSSNRERENSPYDLDYKNLYMPKSGEEILTIVQEKLIESGRKVTKDDIFNYIISLTQNYITVFAGEPGTGKTSLCKLLVKALGLYEKRFADISVERGWTSSKDLIGYYNPLTKEIEKTQPEFSKCMEILSKEKELNLERIPYIVLLDEANLSPIEFYWSEFNYFYDDPENQYIEFSNGVTYKFGKELKFLATINYDHTTEILSPRFLDRAWVILMEEISMESLLSASKEDNETLNNQNLISFDSLIQFFDYENYKNKKINPVTKERLNIIIDKLKSVGHSLSARSIKSIIHFYIVAEEYMTSKEIALDYAVAQKILPLIDGNGKEYGVFLQELLLICKNNQLEKSAKIIQNIVTKSEHDFYNFFSR